MTISVACDYYVIEPRSSTSRKLRREFAADHWCRGAQSSIIHPKGRFYGICCLHSLVAIIVYPFIPQYSTTAGITSSIDNSTSSYTARDKRSISPTAIYETCYDFPGQLAPLRWPRKRTRRVAVRLSTSSHNRWACPRAKRRLERLAR
jgi:hypothetical protein